MSFPVHRPPATTESKFFNAVQRKVVLVVEGQTDRRFWAARISRSTCIISCADSRAAAILAAQDGAKHNQPVVAIVDADFDRIEGHTLAADNILVTDYHDLEVMLFVSPALERVLAEVASPDKLVARFGDAHTRVRDDVFERAKPLGALRLLNHRHHLGFVFRKESKGGFGYLAEHVCTREHWCTNLRETIKALKNYSNLHKLDETETIKRCEALGEHDPRDLCNGHDLMAIPSVGLRKVLGTQNLRPEDVAERFRLAYDDAALGQTTLYATLRKWEAEHPGFAILRESP